MTARIGRVLSIGETLVDLSARPGDPAGHYVAHPGGSPLNVAVGLARLGVAVSFASPGGCDGFGDEVHGFLAAEGVDLSHAPRVSTRTTLAAATLRAGEPVYSFYPEPAPSGAFHVADDIVPGAYAVTHAGSIGLLEPDIYDTAAELFRRGDSLCTLDPNVRLELIDDVAAFRSRTEALIAHSSIVKVSVEDLEVLAPGESTVEVAARYLGIGCGNLVVTAAEHGVMAFGAWGSASAPVSGLPVVDTTGGGDATMVALLSKLASGTLIDDADCWHEALTFAMAVAGITCTRAGGASAMPTPDEVRHFLTQ